MYKIWHVSVRSCLYLISNTYATFKAQFMKKLSNTESELKKGVAYKKACSLFLFFLFIGQWDNRAIASFRYCPGF